MRRVLLLTAATFLAAVAVAPEAKTATARVAALQVGLWHLHLYVGAIDGIEGPLTRRATAGLQRRARLSVDGVVGPQTRRALGRYGRPALGRRILRLRMVGWDVSELQFLLRRRGFPNGPLTGRFGWQTDALLRAFQRTHRLQPDGFAGPLSLRALRHPRAHRLSLLQGVAVRTQIDSWARGYGVDVHLAKALAWMESGYHTNLTSSTGAWGIFQIEPGTWKFVEASLLGRHVARTPVGNIRVGVLYLRYLLREFGAQRRALAAWYEGPTAVRRHKISRETKIFVQDVLALEDRV
jgi:peptidoglycan hydrolase-like protein with peptidoglycan-binding domain